MFSVTLFMQCQTLNEHIALVYGWFCLVFGSVAGHVFLRSQPLVRCFALYLNPFQAHILQKNHRILVQDTNSSRERTLRKSNTDRNTKFNQQHLIQSRKKVQSKTQRTVVPQKSFMNNQHYHGRTVMEL